MEKTSWYAKSDVQMISSLPRESYSVSIKLELIITEMVLKAQKFSSVEVDL